MPACCPRATSPPRSPRCSSPWSCWWGWTPMPPRAPRCSPPWRRSRRSSTASSCRPCPNLIPRTRSLSGMSATTTSGIAVDELSPDVRPQDDLFRHVNARWLAETEIPPDRAAHGPFHELRDQAELDVRALAEEAAAGDAAAGSPERKVGDLWASFMDADGAEARDAAPLADDLADIRAVTSPTELVALMGRLQRHGTPGVLRWYVDNDGDDATRYIVNLVQGGLGLPDEAYYREDAYAEIRGAYVEHVATMLRLVEEPDPEGAAQRIMALETALAAGHWTAVDSRGARGLVRPGGRAPARGAGDGRAAAGRDPAGRLEGVAGVPPRPRRRGLPVQPLRGRRLCLLRDEAWGAPRGG